MKRLAVLVTFAVVSLSLTACGSVDDSSPATCYEIDIDHPSTKKPKTSKPKAPAYKSPRTTKRKR